MDHDHLREENCDDHTTIKPGVEITLGHRT